MAKAMSPDEILERAKFLITRHGHISTSDLVRFCQGSVPPHVARAVLHSNFTEVVPDEYRDFGHRQQVPPPPPLSYANLQSQLNQYTQSPPNMLSQMYGLQAFIDDEKKEKSPKSPFKKGDRVELTANYAEGILAGSLGTIEKNLNGSSDVFIDGVEGTAILISWEMLRLYTKPKVTIDSVVLLPQKKEEIRAAISQQEHANMIFDKWGFGTVFEKGTAISLLFWGVPGCLAADTIVEINRGGKSMPIRIVDLVHRFNGGEIVKGKGAKTVWDATIPTKIRTYVNGYIRLVPLLAAVPSGVKKTFEITTETGKTIRATHDHPFLTDHGWKKLEELQIGDNLVCEGEYKLKGRDKKMYLETSGLSYHPYARSRYRVATHRLVMEAHRNNVDFDTYLKLLNDPNNIDKLSFIDPELYAVNHINGNSLDNRLDNLEVLPHLEHWKQEGQSHCWKNVLPPTDIDKITAITEFGDEETFDLTVDDYSTIGYEHNFLANGLVVHNTGKTLMAQAIADEFDADLKIYATADIQSSEPGGAERMIRTIFREASKHNKGKGRKRVILFDECDSLLMDRNEVGPILGAEVNALLTEIEHYEGIVIFTTNRLGKLDPALERRLSAKIEFEFPDKKARLAIWQRMIPKQAPLHKDVSFEKLAEFAIAGGNIKNAVLSAARHAAYKGHKQINHQHFQDAVKREVASQKAFQDEYEKQTHTSMHGYARNKGGIEVNRGVEMNKTVSINKTLQMGAKDEE